MGDAGMGAAHPWLQIFAVEFDHRHSVGQNEGAQIDGQRHPLGPQFAGLGDRHPAHTVANQNDTPRDRIDNFSDVRSVKLERHLLRRR